MIALCVVACVALSACGRSSSDKATSATHSAKPAQVNFTNWVTEIGPDTIADFERSTGIHVALELIDSNMVLETKLLTGRSGHDVAVPSSNFLGRLIKAGALRKLDRSQLKHLDGLDPAILQLLQQIDPGNQYAMPYLWGTDSFAYNVGKVRKALGADPPQSLATLFEPGIAKRLASCGVTWIDGGGWLMVDLALLSLGRDPNSESIEDLAAAEAALMRTRPFVRYIDTARFDTDLAAGETCVAVGPSGDLLQARDLGRSNGAENEIRYVIPSEGAVLWVDVLVIPADAPHPGEAHRLIDYLLTPQVIAKITNATRFRNGSLAADPMVDAAIRSDPGIYPAAEVLAKLRLATGETAEYSRRQTETWRRVMAQRRR